MDYFGVKLNNKLNKGFRGLDNRGMSLFEIVVSVALIAVITPILFVVFTYGVDIFYSYGRYTEQQDAVTEVLNHIRGDIKNAYQFQVESKKITLTYSDYTQRVWVLADNKLKFVDREGNEQEVVEGIDTNNSSFDYNDFKQVIVLNIQPIKTNSGKYSARNFNKPITTEFSVKYKERIT